MKRFCAVIVSLMVWTFGGCGGGGNQAQVPAGETIVFQRGNAIYAMTPDRSNVRFITKGSGPTLSADGRKIAFFFNPGDEKNVQIFTCDLNGATFKKLTASGGSSPAWSPDGSKIVYSGVTPQETGLFLISSDGSGKKRLTSNNRDEYPSFTPDGQRVSFFRDALYSVNLQGEDEKSLADGGYLGHDWSPDGRSVVYIDGAGGKSGATYNVFLKKFDGSAPIKLTEGSSFKSQPSFSPDGRKVVYTDNVGSTVIIGPGGPSVTVQNLYVLDLATKEVQKITTDGQSENPDWGAR